VIWRMMGGNVPPVPCWMVSHKRHELRAGAPAPRYRTWVPASGSLSTYGQGVA
jgi:hypothetical protein